MLTPKKCMWIYHGDFCKCKGFHFTKIPPTGDTEYLNAMCADSSIDTKTDKNG